MHLLSDVDDDDDAYCYHSAPSISTTSGSLRGWVGSLEPVSATKFASKKLSGKGRGRGLGGGFGSWQHFGLILENSQRPDEGNVDIQSASCPLVLTVTPFVTVMPLALQPLLGPHFRFGFLDVAVFRTTQEASRECIRCRSGGKLG